MYISVYLYDCQGLSAANVDILASDAALIQTHESGFGIGGDFNLEPSELLTCGVVSGLRAQLVVSPNIQGTRSSTGALKVYNYSASESLSKGIAQTELKLNCTLVLVRMPLYASRSINSWPLDSIQLFELR